MAWTLTGVAFEYEGVLTSAHAHGNNVSWTCPFCHHPILFVYNLNQRGSTADRPVECPGCNQRFYLDPPYDLEPAPQGETRPRAAAMRFVRL